MKKNILKAVVSLTLMTSLTACGDKFFETDYYKGIDTETALTNVNNISTALNGTYYSLFYYAFAGNYAISIGDIPTDISYWNGKTGHFDAIYTFTVIDTDTYLKKIWEYGYKVIDGSSRIIKAGEALTETVSEEENAELNRCIAEAYALRGYAQLMLTNIFCHQVKVNGTDYSSNPGIVVVTEPIEALAKVSRSTVGESYNAILSDLNNANKYFDAAGGDRGSILYFNKAAVYGLLARTNLYLENWDEAKANAQKALDEKGISTLTYTPDAYKALFSGNESNTESLLSLAITQTDNWSANSSGTLWSTYNYSPSPKLLSLYGEKDCRQSIIAWDGSSSETVPVFKGGKYGQHATGNSAYATNYLVNAPEMFLIIAEANVKSTNADLNAAKDALLVVARRNSDFSSTSNLPNNANDLLAFIKNERARELFQEGFRLYDLRRWDEAASVYANAAPNISFTYNNYKISDFVFPIPSSEINAGFGVEQNDWAGTLPK